MFRFLKGLTILVILLLIVGCVVFYYAKYWEPYHLKIERVVIQSPYISEQAAGMTIVAVADSHLGKYYTVDRFEEVVDKINSLQPDLVIFAGDLFDDFKRYDGDPAAVSEALSRIIAPDGKFSVFGNHDYGGGAEFNYQEIMGDGGFRVLKNEYVAIADRSMSVIGIDDMLIGYGDTTIGSYARPDYFNLFIAHEPDIVAEMIDYNLDLMLSGHTHGKQINLGVLNKFVLPPLGRDYIRGLYQIDNLRRTQLYVNAGIGMTIMPFRFLSPPEITYITLEPVN